jgi:ectoine hydroxylase-related dioxygenase (phytanoyl-CoA dioxygenase family)
LIDAARSQLKPAVDLDEWPTAADARMRLTHVWKENGASAVKVLALHPELSDMLRVCYGREPFFFQTQNITGGSYQAVHSDATHLHCEPQGVMCGVWIALEDVALDAGPLLYYPGSHRLPYVSAGDLGLSKV